MKGGSVLIGDRARTDVLKWISGPQTSGNWQGSADQVWTGGHAWNGAKPVFPRSNILPVKYRTPLASTKNWTSSPRQCWNLPQVWLRSSAALESSNKTQLTSACSVKLRCSPAAVMAIHEGEKLTPVSSRTADSAGHPTVALALHAGVLPPASSQRPIFDDAVRARRRPECKLR